MGDLNLPETAKMKIEATNFYVEPAAAAGGIITLDEDESYHLAKVMRAKVGEIFSAIDGRGNRYRAQISESNPLKVVAKILEHTRMENEPKCQITLACGICKSAKTDYIIEKGTELGVAEFQFFVSERTYADKVGDSKIERWHNIVKSSAKQSMRTVIPKIKPVGKFEDALVDASDYDLALIAEIGAETNPNIAELKGKSKSVILLVGPESGLSAEEIEKAHKAGFLPYGLGPRRLRAETAAVVFISVVMSQLGEI